MRESADLCASDGGWTSRIRGQSRGPVRGAERGGGFDPPPVAGEVAVQGLRLARQRLALRRGGVGAPLADAIPFPGKQSTLLACRECGCPKAAEGRDAFRRAGLLGQAVVMETENAAADELEYSLVNSGGRLSKMELYWLVKSAAEELLGAKSRFDAGAFSSVCRGTSSSQKVQRPARPWRRSQLSRQVTEAWRTMLCSVLLQATTVRAGPHAPFREWSIDAVAVRAPSRLSRARSDPRLTAVALSRVMESAVRSCSNLVERLNRSYYYYLMVSADRFVPVEIYILPSVLLLLSVLVKVTVDAVASDDVRSASVTGGGSRKASRAGPRRTGRHAGVRRRPLPPRGVDLRGIRVADRRGVPRRTRRVEDRRLSAELRRRLAVLHFLSVGFRGFRPAPRPASNGTGRFKFRAVALESFDVLCRRCPRRRHLHQLVSASRSGLRRSRLGVGVWPSSAPRLSDCFLCPSLSSFRGDRVRRSSSSVVCF